MPTKTSLFDGNRIRQLRRSCDNHRNDRRTQTHVTTNTSGKSNQSTSTTHQSPSRIGQSSVSHIPPNSIKDSPPGIHDRPISIADRTTSIKDSPISITDRLIDQSAPRITIGGGKPSQSLQHTPLLPGNIDANEYTNMRIVASMRLYVLPHIDWAIVAPLLKVHSSVAVLLPRQPSFSHPQSTTESRVITLRSHFFPAWGTLAKPLRCENTWIRYGKLFRKDITCIHDINQQGYYYRHVNPLARDWAIFQSIPMALKNKKRCIEQRLGLSSLSFLFFA